MYLTHDEAVATSLLEQGVPKEVIAVALTNTEAQAQGKELLTEIGMEVQTANGILPFIAHFYWASLLSAVIISVFIILILFAGTLFFFGRDRGYTRRQKR